MKKVLCTFLLLSPISLLAADFTGSMQYTYADADSGPTQINTTVLSSLKVTFNNSFGTDLGMVVAHTATDEKVTDYGWDAGFSYKYKFHEFTETTRVAFRQISIYNGAVQYEQQEASITGHINSLRYSEELNYRVGLFRPYVSFELVHTDTLGQGIKYVKGNYNPVTDVTTVKYVKNIVNSKSGALVYGLGSDFFIDNKFSFRLGYSHSQGSSLYGAGRNFNTAVFDVKYRF